MRFNPPQNFKALFRGHELTSFRTGSDALPLVPPVPSIFDANEGHMSSEKLPGHTGTTKRHRDEKRPEAGVLSAASG